MLLQVVFLSDAALEQYQLTGCLPPDGAFIEDIRLPHCSSLDSLRSFLGGRLDKLEDYRAKMRHTPHRKGAPGNIYVQWTDGPVSQLMPADAIVVDSQVRLRPTEDTRLATSLDKSALANLPATAIEALTEQVEDAMTLTQLRTLSGTVAAQHVSRPARRVLVEVVGWS